MSQIEAVQGQIEITRQLFLSQLEEEISHFQQELGKLPPEDNYGMATNGRHNYQTIIARKRQLLAKLGAGAGQSTFILK
jgi:hypothetical protein